MKPIKSNMKGLILGRDKILFRHMLVFIPGLILTAVALLTAGLSLWKQSLYDSFNTKLSGDASGIFFQLDNEGRNLEGYLSSAERMTAVIDFFEKGNSDSVYARINDFFLEMRNTRDIITFNMYNAKQDSVWILEKKSFEKVTDLHRALQQARDTEEPARDIRLDSSGLGKIRVVKPIFSGDSLIGYLEIAKRIDESLNLAARVLNINLLYTANKYRLNKEEYTNANSREDKIKQWNFFDNMAVVYSSGKIADSVAMHLSKNRECLDETIEKGYKSDIFPGEEQYFILKVPVVNHLQKEIGMIFLIEDETKPMEDYASSGRIIIFATAGIIFLVIAIYYINLKRSQVIVDEKEQSLLESERFLRTLLSEIPAFIYSKDASMRYTSVNTALCEYFGKEESELLGKTDIELFPEFYWKEFVRLDAKVLEDGQKIGDAIVEVDVPGRKKMTVMTNKSPLKDSDGNVIGLAGITIDITGQEENRKELERALQEIDKSQNRLISMMEDAETAKHDAQDARDKLQKAYRAMEEMANKAKAANNAKSEFLANMSHEIRTPLNGIIGMSNMLADSGLSGDQKYFAEILKSSGESLLDIINDILDFSKIESGKMELEESEFNFYAMWETVTASAAIKCDEKGIEFNCIIAPEIPEFVTGDSVRMKQIINNLLGNAVKFTERGEISVVCETEEVFKETNRYKISVIDTGIGIEKDKQSILFDKFTQADSSTTRRFGGTGLGLTIAVQLAELMNGTIEVESEPGKGSVFTLFVELKKSKRKNTPADYSGFEDKKIMVIDDIKTTREIIGTFLSRGEIAYSSFENAREALQELRSATEEKAPFHAVLIDYQMPGMNGSKLCEEILNDKQIDDIKTVLISTPAKRDKMKRNEGTHFDCFLPKPINAHKLYKCLSTIFSEEKQEMASQVQTNRSDTESEINAGNRPNYKILLVEDNITNRIVARKILEKSGYTVAEAIQGQKALEMLKTERYDLIFMDMLMPVLNGIETTLRIRSGEAGEAAKNIPIVAMTANAMSSDREKCISAGMNDFMSKPVTPDKVRTVLRKWLSRKEKSKPTASPDKLIEKSADTEIWDKDALLARVMHDSEIASTVLGFFLDDTPNRIKRLADAVESESFSVIEREAHTIKGAASDVGATKIRMYGEKIEESADKRQLSVIKALLLELQNAYGEFAELFEK